MPPKKGKGKKKSSLTEDQKKQKAEEKVLADKEKLIHRRDLTKTFLTLKKEKEYELIKSNEKKILNMWRPIIRKIKIAELLQDYQLIQHAFERAFNRKTNLIQEVEKTLEQTEGEYDNAVDMHMYNIDKMMEFYKKRIKEICETMVLNRKLLLDKIYEEKFRIKEHHKKSLRLIIDKMVATEKRFHDHNEESKIELMMKKEYIRNNDIQELQLYTSKVDEKVKKYWQIIHDRISFIEQTTRNKRKEFIILRGEDLKTAESIDIHFTRYAILKNGIVQLNKRTALFRSTYNNYIEDLKEMKTKYREVHNEYMTRRRLVSNSNKQKLTVLAITSKNVVEGIGALLLKREKILKTTEVCRRREQLEEKVDPFLKRFNMVPFTIDDDEGISVNPRVERQNMSNNSNQISITKSFVQRVVHNFECNCKAKLCVCERVADKVAIFSEMIQSMVTKHSLLEKFWMRFNKVSVDKGALQAVRKNMMTDNSNLKVALRNYVGGVNPSSLTSGRFDEQIMEFHLQKAQKVDQLSKRRCSCENLNFNIGLYEPLNPSTLNKIVKCIFSANEENQYNGVQIVRRILTCTHQRAPDNSSLIISAGILPKCVKFLYNKRNHNLQFEAAWVLTNIAAGNSAQTEIIVKVGAVEPLINLLRSPINYIVEQAAWALGNIAGNGPTLRDYVISKGILAPLIELVNPPAEPTILRTVAWTLLNLCKATDQTPVVEVIQQCLPALARLIMFDDIEIITETCWALSYLGHGSKNAIENIIKSGVIPRMVDLLNSNNCKVITACLRAVGNIVTGSNSQTQVVLNCNVLTILKTLLTYSEPKIVKEAAWIISNIVTGTIDQIYDVLNAGLVPLLIQIINHGNFSAKKEALWAITNITCREVSEHIVFLYENDAVAALCKMLTVIEIDWSVIMVVLDGLSHILKVGSSEDDLFEKVVCAIEECGGLENIKLLQSHDNETVSVKAQTIIHKYFERGELEDESSNEVELLQEEINNTSFNLEVLMNRTNSLPF